MVPACVPKVRFRVLFLLLLVVPLLDSLSLDRCEEIFSLTIATASYALIERPFLRLEDRKRPGLSRA